MTFDTHQLPGRAAELKKKGIEMLVAMFESGDMSGGAGYGTSEKLAEQSMAGVEHIYDDFVDIPAPENFVYMTEGLARAMGKLATQGYTKDPVSNDSHTVGTANQNLYGVASSGDYLDNWTGEAADAYNVNYADRFVPVTSNQFVLASVARNAINAEAAIWQTVRADLDKLSSDAIKKMDECMDCSPSDWNMLLTVAGAVVAIAAVPLTGGTSLELGIAAVSAGLSVTATGISGSGGQPDELGLATGNPIKIVESLADVLGKVKSYVLDHENTIYNQMSTTESDLNGHYDAICLPRPDLAGAAQHPVNDPHEIGVDA